MKKTVSILLILSTLASAEENFKDIEHAPDDKPFATKVTSGMVNTGEPPNTEVVEVGEGIYVNALGAVAINKKLEDMTAENAELAAQNASLSKSLKSAEVSGNVSILPLVVAAVVGVLVGGAAVTLLKK